MFHLSKSKHVNFARIFETADSLAGRISFIKRRRRIRRFYKILKYFCLGAAAVLLVLVILFSAKILSFIWLYDQAVSGKVNLEQALAFARENKFAQASVLARTAENNFEAAATSLGQVKNDRLAKQFPFFTSQLDGLENLLVSAGFLSRAVSSGAELGEKLSKMFGEELNFNKLKTEEKRRVLGKMFESAPELNGVQANLKLAYLNSEQISPASLLLPLRQGNLRIRQQIDEAGRLLDKAVFLSQLLPALTGYSEGAAYLVLFEDDRELRPSGGLLSAYGVLTVKDGEILSFNTHDFDYLEGRVKDKTAAAAPEPVKRLSQKWHLRDAANWSPDWPTAARQIDWFYQRASAPDSSVEKISKLSGVIALTPKLIADFLAVTGPVTALGKTYDKANFQDLLKSNRELSAVSARPNPEIIGETIKELKVKIFDLPPADLLKIMNAVTLNLAAKNLLLYFADKQLENIALANGWGGEVKAFSGDYLMVVDANLGAARTDAALNRSLEYKVTAGANGLFSRLTLGYAYRGQLGRGGSGVYKSYTRIYAPLGAELIGLSGYEPKQIEVGSESGKTFFGFYLTVEAEKIKNLIMEYKLPSLISSPKNYGLYIQKQPGREVKEAIVDLSFINEIKSYSPASLSTQKLSPGRLKWQGDLNIDRSFEVKF